ncbi:MAG: hypothetical protein WBK67_01425 [Minisyncoccales bacterium]|jgi:hypothetical protein
MQIFEFQFNPRRKDYYAETLFYESDKTEEGLYIVGEIKNIISGGEKFLIRLMREIRDEYRDRSLEKKSDALEKALIKANESLSIEIAKDNVSWLGNLNMAVLSISEDKIEIAKIGKIEVFLIGYKKVSELSDKTGDGKTNDKVFKPNSFNSRISGNLKKGDRIAFLTEDLVKHFTKSRVLEQVSEFHLLDNKVIEDFIGKDSKDINKINGVFLLLDTNRVQKEKKSFLSEKEVDFSTKEVFLWIKDILKKIPVLKRKRAFPSLQIKVNDEYKKGFVLVAIMIFILVSGFFIFHKNDRINKSSQLLTERIRDDIDLADDLISSYKNDQAFSVLSDAYKKSFEAGFDNLLEEIALKLEKVSKIEEIRDIDPLISIQSDEIVPQRIIFSKESVYLYGPLSDKIAVLDLKTKDIKIYDSQLKLGSSTIYKGSPIFFVKPNLILSLEDDELSELAQLELPRKDMELTGLISFENNIYLRDSSTDEILKYSSFEVSPDFWFKSDNEKPSGIKSMTTDGFIWILDSDNQVIKYRLGAIQKSFSINLFPFVKYITRISTSPTINYLFFLEPAQKRVIITDKNGKLIKQITSDKFNNLADFSLSEDGKRLFLLNGSDIYLVTI